MPYTRWSPNFTTLKTHQSETDTHWEWVITEKLYGWFALGAYADEHISHYSRRELIERFESCGFTLEAVRYILRGELIVALRKGR